MKTRTRIALLCIVAVLSAAVLVGTGWAWVLDHIGGAR